MAASDETASMALFCDFENVALGVRDAKYEKFDIRPVLERLLAKGSIVVKKAYCDWDRYKGFKAAMHEANFELIEIPHVRQSGKNSADIRLVVDALDLCYTKSHVNTFVIISGDSDFSPLVSKLRENAKRVIGVGVKQSCSDLLIANCDEFIYYDDLVRERNGVRRESREAAPRRSPEEEKSRGEKLEARKAKAVDLVAVTFADLIADRGESERVWASVLKEVVKRRNPGFNESYFGFRSFGNLLEEAAQRGLLGFGRDDKGAYVFRAPARAVPVELEGGGEPISDEPLAEPAPPEAATAEPEAGGNGRRRGGRRGRGKERGAPETAETLPVAGEAPVMAAENGEIAVDRGTPAGPEEAAPDSAPAASRRRGSSRRGRQDAVGQPAGAAASSEPVAPLAAAVEAPGVPAAAAAAEESAVSAKPRRGGRRPRQDTVAQQVGETPAPASEPAPAAVEQAAAPKRAARTPRSRKPKAAAG